MHDIHLQHDCPAEGVPLRSEQFANGVEVEEDAWDADEKPTKNKRGKGRGGRGKAGRGRGGKGRGKGGKGKGKVGKEAGRGCGGRGRGKGRGRAATKPGSSGFTTPTRRPRKGDDEPSSQSESKPKACEEDLAVPPASNKYADKPKPPARKPKASAKKPKAKAKPAGKKKSSPSTPEPKGKAKRKADSQDSRHKEEGGRDKCFARRYKPTRESATLQWMAIRDAFNDHLRQTLLCPSKLEDSCNACAD